MRKNLRGFTLLEVLVALAVAAVGLAGVIKASGGNAFNAQHLSNKTLAQWVAMNQLAQMRMTKQFPPVGSAKGDAEMAGIKWYWQQETRAPKIAMQALSQNLREVEINVYKDEAHKTGSLATVITYLSKQP